MFIKCTLCNAVTTPANVKDHLTVCRGDSKQRDCEIIQNCEDQMCDCENRMRKYETYVAESRRQFEQLQKVMNQHLTRLDLSLLD
jgi:hypothetical protein